MLMFFVLKAEKVWIVNVDLMRIILRSPKETITNCAAPA